MPVKPKKGKLLIIGTFLGMMLGIAFVMIQRSISKGVTDSEKLQEETGLSVFASIPYSNIQNKLAKSMSKRDDQQSGMNLLVMDENKGVAAEAFRSLRTSMQFASKNSENNIVVISGPSAGVGKSFVTANIGALLSESGKKILVIDADMRRGHLYRFMGVSKSPGLSELISSNIEFEQAIVKINENMSFLPTGKYPPNPAELLMTDEFQSLLAKCSEQFDLVIIDTPPILAVTDASIIAKNAAQFYLLLGYGKHRMKEINSAISRFKQNGIHITGAIMNDVDMKSSGRSHDDYYYYYYAQK
jgi:tyrosine-protein kinase Etk/Wzc